MACIDLTAFRACEEEGYITCRAHPQYDVLIWNYTPRAQYEHVWNEVTMQARGLITTSTGEIVARPFKKFMNLEEYEGNLPVEPFKVTEKMDGSLGILYIVDGKAFIATRGSFVSEQAERATKILYEKYSAFIPHFVGTAYYTYLFEIIYPENRICVNYGEMEDLVLLAVIQTETGEEYDIHNPTWVQMWPFPVVRHYDGITDYTTLKALQEPNREGFVIRFESGLRLKIKFSEYVRLHRILTQCTARTIWECLREGLSFDDLLTRVPDEFYAWVQATKAALIAQYTAIEQEAQRVVQEVKGLSTRKEQAARVVGHPHSAVIFAMLDNKPYAERIWKSIKPSAEKPFREDEEG